MDVGGRVAYVLCSIVEKRELVNIGEGARGERRNKVLSFEYRKNMRVVENIRLLRKYDAIMENEESVEPPVPQIDPKQIVDGRRRS